MEKLKPKPSHSCALVPPAWCSCFPLHKLRQELEIHLPNPLPHACHAPVPGFLETWPRKIYSSFVGRNKTRTKNFNKAITIFQKGDQTLTGVYMSDIRD
jgi:hypothetical protein